MMCIYTLQLTNDVCFLKLTIIHISLSCMMCIDLIELNPLLVYIKQDQIRRSPCKREWLRSSLMRACDTSPT